jgi:hypothetical protein
VVRLLHGDHVIAPRPRLPEAKREVDGLRPAVDQEDGVERVGCERGEALGEFDDGRVVEPRVRVEQAPLLGDGLHQTRVGVTHRRHVVEGIEVHPSVGVDEMLAPPPHHDRWIGVVVLLHVGERLATACQQGRGIHRRGGLRAGRPGDEFRGIGDDGAPGGDRVGGDEVRCRDVLASHLHPQRFRRFGEHLAGGDDRARGKRRAASGHAQRECVRMQLDAVVGRLYGSGPRRRDPLRP